MGKDSEAMTDLYVSGVYFADGTRHSGDAEFKASEFLKLFLPLAKAGKVDVNSYADVGCGTGDVVKIVAASLNVRATAYDVSPHVQALEADGIEFVRGDFTESGETADLVTLFDVFEHVPDPITFIKRVGERCRYIGFHIPLDDHLSSALRDNYRDRVATQGHLIYMDTASALNILALSGMIVLEYKYTRGFMLPSARSSLNERLLFPLRYLLGKISPWILSKTIGGVSLMVIAITPKGRSASSSWISQCPTPESSSVRSS